MCAKARSGKLLADVLMAVLWTVWAGMLTWPGPAVSQGWRSESTDRVPAVEQQLSGRHLPTRPCLQRKNIRNRV